MDPVSSSSSHGTLTSEKTEQIEGSLSVPSQDQEVRQKVARTFQEVQSSSDASLEPPQKRCKAGTEETQQSTCSKPLEDSPKKDPFAHDWLMEEEAGNFTYFHGQASVEFVERVPQKDEKSKTVEWLSSKSQSCDLLWLYIHSTIPESLKQMASLRTLVIMGQNTGEKPPVIPGWLFTLPLTQLTIVTCQLSSLPSTIGGMKALQFLNVDSNELTTIPAEIAKLPALQQANFVRNPIKRELVPTVLNPLIKNGKILLVSKVKDTCLYGPWK
jgi:hypothetical protein